ncbi:MAG TPA: hypothetical protein PKA82_09695 [Pyrinomonadaceae bacterium]|nr:hypothetical protein [Pyrinomonadaceae bacterium]
MATNAVLIGQQIPRESRWSKLTFENKFFLIYSVAFPLITFIGYAPTFYLKPLFQTPPIAGGLVIAHGVLMTAWIVLFGVQAYLVSAKKVRTHITLGMLGISIATAMVFVGVVTAIESLKRGAAFPGWTANQWFIIPIADMVVFPILFAAAIYLRHDSASHKRLMLLIMVNWLGPSIARFPLAFILDLGTLWFFGVPALIAAGFLAYDTYRNGKMNKAFAIGFAISLISWPLRLAISYTDAWEKFATLVSWS